MDNRVYISSDLKGWLSKKIIAAVHLFSRLVVIFTVLSLVYPVIDGFEPRYCSSSKSV